MIPDDDPTQPWKAWRTRIAAAKQRVEDLIGHWQENVDARRGKSAETALASNISINQDWPLTKAKIAQLFSQVPEVRLSPKSPLFQAAVPQFARVLNDTLTEASVGSAIEEVLADVVNASGIGGVIVSCEKRTETKDVPLEDPMIAAMSGREPQMTQVEAPVDIQYLVQRISPADLLIPSDFTGSNYDHARWLGRRGRMTWAQATIELGVTEDQKEKVLSGDARKSSQNSLNTDTSKFRDTDVVNFSEVFYWRHYYHAEETSFKAIQRLVFVDGLEEPSINIEYTGQKRIGTTIVGVTKLPIRICTLTYISDDSLPPSDSSIGRFQVDELRESRDAMVEQRKHSIPIRWYNPTLVSPGGKSQIEKGEIQGFIPINGMGDRAIGEVARASFPQEKFEFDRIIKSDLTEIWQVGTNQAGAFASGERSAREAGIIEKNFQTRVGQERDKTSKFYVGIAEVTAGHVALYGQFDLPLPPEIPKESIANGFAYSVRVDSTVLLDSEQRIEQLTRALNLTAQSGYVNPKPVIAEIWELSGVDPSTVVVDPQPKPPEPVKVSIGSAEDIINPVMLGALMRTGQAPTPEDIAAAIKLLTEAAAGGVPLVPPQAPDEGGPPREPETPGIANPEWETAPRVERRAEDGGA